MNRTTLLLIVAALAGGLVLGGCQTAMKEPSASAQPAAAAGPYDKPGFQIEVDDGRLWVLKPGEAKSGKYVTLIGAGPHGMTVRALERDTALEYIAAKPGFDVEVQDGRLWVLKPGQEKSGKYVTLIGAGPQNMTLRALDMDTALAYLAAKPGYDVQAEEGRLWVLKPGQEKSGKYATRIAAGPKSATLRGVDMETLDAYLADKHPVGAATVRTLFDGLIGRHPGTTVELAWNQPFLTHDGRRLFSVGVMTSHLLAAPWSAAVLDAFRPVLTREHALTVNSRTFRLPLDWEIDERLLDAIVTAERAAQADRV
jgi:uncharacterized protein YdhG (YjbR/CyaY superfamily)